ncbi:MAG TPA: cupin domain-containing protein, partial [Fimbriimonas sp.]
MKYFTYLFVALVCLAIGRWTSPAMAQAQEPAFTNAEVKNLFKRALDENYTPGREVLVDRVEVPPNTTLDRHWHPGEEFHYYLKGEPFVALRNEQARQVKEGTVGHVPFKAEHVLSTKEKGTTLIVFRVHTAGQP